MKKLLLLLTTFTLFSCSQPEELNTIDCDCDRVVQVYTFKVIGTPEQPAMNYFSTYTTINDCTQIQLEKTFNTTNQNQVPKIGDCR